MIPQLFLQRAPKGTLRPGHPWIYASQLMLNGVQVAPGSLVDVLTERGRYVGRGYCNTNSQIAVRLLSAAPDPIDSDYFRRRIERAYAYRRRFIHDTNAFRVISSEADGLPGLIVDLYSEVLVVQFLTAGMENLKPIVLEALSTAIPSRGIYERSDSGVRRLEGLAEKKGWIEKNCGDEVIVRELDIEYLVEFGEGHKTGFYLDQRENRTVLRNLGIQGRVLDAFCYEGGFGLHLAKGGANVTGIDIKAANLARGTLHRQRNGIPEEKLRFKEADVFEELRELDAKKEKFDLVILDPPSFVKKKDELDGAMAGFKEISLRAMKILEEGGLLALFSCSYHVDENRLMQVALSAAQDTKKNLKVVRFMSQGMDHPIDPAIPETYYLKGFLFQVSAN